MANITYFAVDRGKLISGHSEGTEYNLDVPISNFQESTRRKQKTITSLSGQNTTILHHIIRRASVSTSPSEETAVIDGMREFLDSVAGGEVFQIDLYGSSATPLDPKNYRLEGNYSESLVDITGFYKFSFKVKEV